MRQAEERFALAIDAPPAKVKRDYSRLINLSSNEFCDSRFDISLRDIVSATGPGWIGRYPLESNAKATTAAFLTCAPTTLSLWPGSDSAIRALIALSSRSCHAIYVEPNIYEAYSRYAQLFGIPIHTLDITSYAVASSEIGPGDIVVCSRPNGLTGQTLSASVILDLVSQIGARGATTFVDEAYADFDTESLTAQASRRDDLVVIHTFSKSLGCAGLRMAAVAASPRNTTLISRWESSRDVSVVSLEYARYWLSQRPILKEIWNDMKARRHRLREVLESSARCDVLESSANFLYADFQRPAERARLLSRLDASGIVIRTIGDGAVRISVPASDSLSVVTAAIVG